MSTGEPSQRKIRDFNGASLRSARIRATRGHYGEETEDDHDSVRVPHGARLHPGHGRARRQRVRIHATTVHSPTLDLNICLTN